MSDPVPEPGSPPPDPTPPPNPPEQQPAWAPDPDEWQATQQQLQELAQIVQPQPPPWQQAPQAPPVPDPFADDYAQQMQAYMDHVTAPMRQWQEQQQLSAAQEQAMSTLSQLAEKDGAFDRDMAWARANQLILENGGDPHKALQQAAVDTRAYEQKVRDDAIAAYQQQIQNVAGAPRGQLPVGVGGAQTVPTGGYGNVPNAVTRKIFGPITG